MLFRSGLPAARQRADGAPGADDRPASQDDALRRAPAGAAKPPPARGGQDLHDAASVVEEAVIHLRLEAARFHPIYFLPHVVCPDSRSGGVFNFATLTQEEEIGRA